MKTVEKTTRLTLNRERLVNLSRPASTLKSEMSIWTTIFTNGL